MVVPIPLESGIVILLLGMDLTMGSIGYQNNDTLTGVAGTKKRPRFYGHEAMTPLIMLGGKSWIEAGI